MKLFPSLLLLVLISAAALAQKSPVKFGDIPMEDMTMTSYPQDTSAAYVYLLDYCDAHFEVREGHYKLVFNHHTRIKVLRSDNSKPGDFTVSLYGNASTQEKISGLKGFTYNLESGQIVKSQLVKENIFREKVNKNITRQKFTMPNVKAGSVLEYVYTVNSDYVSRFPNWAFQHTVPVRRSEFYAILPSDFTMEKYMQGYITPAYDLKKTSAYNVDVNIHHWVMENSPAFREEPRMTSDADYISRINFALAGYHNGVRYIDIMGSWESLTKDLLESDAFGLAIAKSGFLKDKADELTAGLTDPLKKIEAIHTYVKQNIEWDDTEDFEADNLKKVVEAKKGSIGDINILMASLLNKAGFDVDMVLLSTRDHGFIREQYPMRHQFNYVIGLVTLGDKNIFLDASEKYLPYTILPERCLNGQGLLVSPKRSGWIDIPAKTKSRTIVSANLTLTPEGTLSGDVTFTGDGYDALDMRKEYATQGETEYVKDFLEGRQWKVEKTEFTDMMTLDKPIKQIHKVNIDEHASVAGNVIYINPFIASRNEENEFKSETRTYPVDFGTLQERLYVGKIALPDGITVDELPKSKAMALPGNAARFTYSVVQLGSMINITSSLQINKALFVQNEYPGLREFYAQVIAKEGEQIVLKKK